MLVKSNNSTTIFYSFPRRTEGHFDIAKLLVHLFIYFLLLYLFTWASCIVIIKQQFGDHSFCTDIKGCVF